MTSVFRWVHSLWITPTVHLALPLPHPVFSPVIQEKNGVSSAMDLDRIEVENDAVRALSVFHCGQQLREGAKAVNLPKFWVSGFGRACLVLSTLDDLWPIYSVIPHFLHHRQLLSTSSRCTPPTSVVPAPTLTSICSSRVIMAALMKSSSTTGPRTSRVPRLTSSPSRPRMSAATRG